MELCLAWVVMTLPGSASLDVWPAAPPDFRVDAQASDTRFITLKWTAPGYALGPNGELSEIPLDGGARVEDYHLLIFQGPPPAYTTDADWESAENLLCYFTWIMDPGAAGALETYAMELGNGQDGLSWDPTCTYHFALRAVAGSNNCSGFVLCDSSALTDTGPPPAVTDLDVIGRAGDAVTLQWTVPSDDRGIVAYDLRHSTEPILTDPDFDSSTPVLASPVPGQGALEIFTVEGLPLDATHWFALRSSDIWSWSQSSNTAMAGPPSPPGPDAPASTGDVSCQQSAAGSLAWAAWAALLSAALATLLLVPGRK